MLMLLIVVGGNGGDVKNGESKKANKSFFDTDEHFNIYNYFKFCTRYLKEDGCMLLFCSFEQLFEVINIAKENGFKKYIPLVFIKNYSPQVLKANMKILGATEYGLSLYKERLPKFRNKDEQGKGHMIFNWFEFKKDCKSPRIHPTQKPVDLLERLIKIFTDEGDVVLDPVARFRQYINSL